MNIFKAIGHAFVVTGKFLVKGFKAAKASGLTDALVQSLLEQYVPKAAALWPDDNNARREWVINEVVKDTNGKVPEHIARLALEVAIAQVKAAVDKDEPEPTAPVE